MSVKQKKYKAGRSKKTGRFYQTKKWKTTAQLSKMSESEVEKYFVEVRQEANRKYDKMRSQGITDSPAQKALERTGGKISKYNVEKDIDQSKGTMDRKTALMKEIKRGINFITMQTSTKTGYKNYMDRTYDTLKNTYSEYMDENEPKNKKEKMEQTKKMKEFHIKVIEMFQMWYELNPNDLFILGSQAIYQACIRVAQNNPGLDSEELMEFLKKEIEDLKIKVNDDYRRSWF